MKKQLLLQPVFCFLFLWLVVNCKSSDDTAGIDTPVPTPTQGCRLYSSSNESKSVDAAGRITNTYKGIYLYFTKDTTYTNAAGTTSVKFIYDSNNYLVKRTDNFKASAQNTESQTEITYSYVNGRLSEMSTITLIDRLQTGKSLEQYSYDSQGQLSRLVTTRSDGSQVIRSFTGGVQTKYETKDAQGQLTDLTATFNAQGYQSKRILDADWEYRDFYDSEGNFIKREEWLQGKLYAYTEFETGPKNRQSEAYPTYKGHPVIPATQGSATKLTTKSVGYRIVPGANSPTKTGESSTSYVLNKQGFVEQQTTLRTNYDVQSGQVTVTTNETTMNKYIGCP